MNAYFLFTLLLKKLFSRLIYNCFCVSFMIKHFLKLEGVIQTLLLRSNLRLARLLTQTQTKSHNDFWNFVKSFTFLLENIRRSTIVCIFDKLGLSFSSIVLSPFIQNSLSLNTSSTEREHVLTCSIKSESVAIRNSQLIKDVNTFISCLSFQPFYHTP